MTLPAEPLHASSTLRLFLQELRDDPHVSDDHRRRASDLLAQQLHSPDGHQEEAPSSHGPVANRPADVQEDDGGISPEDRARYLGPDTTCESLERALAAAAAAGQGPAQLRQIYSDRVGRILDSAEWIDMQHGYQALIHEVRDRLRQVRSRFGIARTKPSDTDVDAE